MKTLRMFIAGMLCIVLTLGIFAFPARAAAQSPVTPPRISAAQQVYPEGTTCTNATPAFHVCIRWPGCLMSAQGCWGFAILFVAQLYDLDLTKNLSVTFLEINGTVSRYYPKTPYASARESLQLGDILVQINPGHAMVVIGMDDAGVLLGEGNYGGGTVHYGRHLSFEAIDQHLAYVFRILPPESASSDCPCSKFNDMPAEGTPEHEAIDWAYTHEPPLAAGTGSAAFGPDMVVTRAQALTFLWRAVGMPEPKTSVCPFADVPGGAYYRKAVLWAVENGITSGTSRTLFSPKKLCSRSEIITFLWRVFGSPSPQRESTYSDVSGKWYATPAAWAQESAVETGQNGLFAPHTACTRAAAILYIYRAFTGAASSGCTP